MSTKVVLGIVSLVVIACVGLALLGAGGVYVYNMYNPRSSAEIAAVPTTRPTRQPADRLAPTQEATQVPALNEADADSVAQVVTETVSIEQVTYEVNIEGRDVKNHELVYTNTEQVGVTVRLSTDALMSGGYVSIYDDKEDLVVTVTSREIKTAFAGALYLPVGYILKIDGVTWNADNQYQNIYVEYWLTPESIDADATVKDLADELQARDTKPTVVYINSDFEVEIVRR